MGYETKLFVANMYPENSNEISGHVIAAIDLSKTGYDSRTYAVLLEARHVYKSSPDAKLPHEIYNTGADLAFVLDVDKPADMSGIIREVDYYGDHISPVPLEALHDAMEEDQKEYVYHRFTLALALLRPLRAGVWGERPPVIWQFGY